MNEKQSVRPLDEQERQSLAYRIGDEAMRHAGFMIASKETRDDGKYGFNFLVNEHLHIAAVHGSVGADGRVEVKKAYWAARHHDQFIGRVMDYLAQTAFEMGIDKHSLARGLYEKRSIWRFVGYVNGAESRHPDNGSFWRPLWPALVRFVDAGGLRSPFPKDTVHAIVAPRLRSCGVEGQTVLDR